MGYADYVREKLSDPTCDKEYIRGILIAGFVRSAMDSAWHARRNAGVTQQQIAEETHTKQPAVARFERDRYGTTSMERFASYTLACGYVPMLTLVPIDEALEYTKADPSAPRTAEAFLAWRAKQQTSNKQ